MAVTLILARPPYAKRDVPREYTQGWWVVELGNIQRAIPVYAQHAVLGGQTYQPTAGDRTILCDTTAGAVTIALLPPGLVKGLELIIKKTAGTNAVNLVGRVDGVANPSLTGAYASITIQSDGTQWLQTASHP